MVRSVTTSEHVQVIKVNLGNLHAAGGWGAGVTRIGGRDCLPRAGVGGGGESWGGGGGDRESGENLPESSLLSISV